MNNQYISDLQLERYLLNELPDKQTEKIKTMLKSDPQLKERLHNLENSNIDILEKYPSEQIVSNIKNLAKFKQTKSVKTKKYDIKNLKKFIIPTFSFSAVMTIFLFVFFINEPGIIDNNDSIEITRPKGEAAQLYIYRKDGNSVSILSNGAKAKENDLLQIAYQSTKNTHGMIFSIDGRGNITLQYPKTIYSSTKLKSKKKEALPSAYQLDDAPNFEIFYFITSPYPFDKERVLEQAKVFAKNLENVKTKPLPIDKELDQVSFKLLK